MGSGPLSLDHLNVVAMSQAPLQLDCSVVKCWWSTLDQTSQSLTTNWWDWLRSNMTSKAWYPTHKIP